MKRDSSLNKENAMRSSITKLSARKRPSEQQLSTLSTTHTLFHPSSQKSINPTQSSMFYRTLGNNNLLDWARPESKQAYRRHGGRPQTSKGVRPMERVSRKWNHQTKMGAFHSQYLPERPEDDYKQDTPSSIEIIVTKGKRPLPQHENKSKFETDLDDEFLQLFAN